MAEPADGGSADEGGGDPDRARFTRDRSPGGAPGGAGAGDAESGEGGGLDPLTRLVHDLRSPLTVVEGFAHLLERDDATLDATSRAEYANRIRAAADEMRALLDRAG